MANNSYKSIVREIFALFIFLCISCSAIYAQTNIRVHGVVLNQSDNAPVVGVSVMLMGTSTGTATDASGRFTITAPTGATLQFKSVGYVDQLVQVSGDELTISLVTDQSSLDEVVVVGYGTSRKKDITGSVVSVKVDELNPVAASSVTQMLQGRVTGMSAVRRSAQPGAGMGINIRGAVSPSGNNAPLYVIDGVPMQTNTTADPGLDGGFDFRTGVDRDPLNTINPADIESIEVLKDASAAAIYGASAANGVILITTKSGKSGRVNVNFNSVYTAQIQKPYPEVLRAREFREQTNLWSSEWYLYQNKMGVYGSNPIDFSGYTPVFSSVDNYSTETDWLGVVSRPGYVLDNNLTMNGGTDKTKYFFSYNYHDNEGMLKNSDLARHNIRLNLDQTFSPRVKAGIKMNYSNILTNSTSVGDVGNGDNMMVNVMRFGPDIPIRDQNGNYTRSHNQIINNPASFLDLEDQTKTDRIFIAPTFEVRLMDGLTLQGVGGYDRQQSTRSFYVPLKAQFVGVQDGLGQLGYTKSINVSAESFFNYEKNIDNKHRISAVLGAGYYKTGGDGFRLTARDFFTDAFGTDNIGIAGDRERQVLSSWRNERIKLSQFFRVNYALLDKYIVTATGRRDGSSYFAANNKWGFFPSISGAWRLSEEDFLRDVTALSDFKLRVGYGATGNENVIGTNALAAYSSGYGYLFGSNVRPGLMLTRFENPNLKWETNYTFNVGLDWGLFDQKISGTVEYFKRGAKDLLDFQTLPSNSAVGRIAANIGETKSEGFEFSLRSDNLRSEKVRWETVINLSYFMTNWVNRNPEVSLANYIGIQDELDAIYGWKSDGIITSTDQIPDYMPNAELGNIKYVDVNGDGVLDSRDVVKLGNATPRWMASMANTVNYKSFDLNIFVYGNFGYLKSRGQVPDAQAIGNRGTGADNTFRDIITDVYNSQTGQGFLPGVAANVYDGQNPAGNSDFWLMKGSFVRINNVTLGYTIPRDRFDSNKFLKGARFFVDAQNIAFFTGYHGFDPELNVSLPYPQALSLSVGLNLTL